MPRLTRDIATSGRGRRATCAAFFGLAAAATISSTADAQGTSQPLAPTREEIERRQPATPPPPSRLQVEGELERGPCALANPEYAGIRFTLRDVRIEGLRGVSPESLRPAYQALAGREQPVAVVCDVRDRVASLLREAGYIASVQVPEQSIADGTLRLNVLMAKLVQVRVRGDAGRAENTIAGYLERLTEQEVFNRFDAERYLLLASDLPGYNVRLALRPAGTQPGEVIGEVTVVRMPFALDANIQNYGSRELGRWSGLLRAQAFGLTGLGDVTTASFFSTADFDELLTAGLSHEFRVGPEGMGIYGGVDYSWAKPDLQTGENVDAQTLFATAAVSYPFIRRQAHSLRGAIGMDFVNQYVELDDEDFTRDRLRVAFARLTGDAASMNFSRPGFSMAEPVWRMWGMAEVRQGLDVFGATKRCGAGCLASGRVPPSRIGADPTAALARVSLYGEYRPGPKLTLAFGVRGQYSADPLLSFEQFAAGNFTIGRGYDPGALLGDRGIGVLGEIRLGSLLPRTARALAAQPYVFFDLARVGNEDETFLARGKRDLTSLGGGIRATIRDFALDAMLAIPLERTGFTDGQPDPRLLFSLTRRLWPWSL